MDLFVVGNIIIFIALLIGLIVLRKKKVSFSIRVFSGLIAGIIFGFLLQWFYRTSPEKLTVTGDWLNIIGSGYVSLLQMIVMPLIFISILSAFTKMESGKGLGKMAALVLLVLLGTTVIAAGIGVVTTTSFQLEATDITQGADEIARGEDMEERSSSIEGQTLPDQILAMLPKNPFLDFTGARPTSTIAVVIFTTLLGFAYLRVRKYEKEIATTIEKGVHVLYTWVMELVKIILRLTPYGVLALMTQMIIQSDLAAIMSLGKFVIASYVAIILMFFVQLLLLALNGISPITYVKKTFETLTFAFVSRSSAGALPMNIRTQVERLGVPDGVANFSGSFGLSIGQNGCAGIYPAMLAAMIAPTLGINPLDPTFFFSLLLIVMISSFGVAGVGGGATFAAIIVLSILDFPIALAGILISIEPLIDMGRTALNVSGSMISGTITAKRLGTLDEETFRA